MTPRACIALFAVIAAAPLAARAHGPDYPVSVDVGVSGGVTFDTFYGPLSPYGEWVTVGSHGRAWRPRVAAGWRPYYYGRWEWTNEGWLWVSDEPYGWAVYHYGRWAHDPYFGWVWVPGYEWAPAWVSWRTSGDVIGWAPLAPGFSVYVTTYPFVDFWWTFVPTVRFVSVPVYSVAYAPGHTRRWFHHTAPAPARPAPRAVAGRPAPAPAPAWGGPPPRLIAERTGRAPTPVRVVPSQAPAPRAARPGEIAVFRPDARPAPSRGAAAGARGAAAFGPRDTPPSAAPAPGRARPDVATPRAPGREDGRGAAGAAAGVAPPPRGPAMTPAPPAPSGRGAAGAASGVAPPARGPAMTPTPPPPPAGRGAAGAASRVAPPQRAEPRAESQRASPAWRSEPRGRAPSPAPARGGGAAGGGGREERGAPPPRR